MEKLVVIVLLLVGGVWFSKGCSSTSNRPVAGSSPVAAVRQPTTASATSNVNQAKVAEINQKIAKLNSGRAASQALLDKATFEKEALAEKLRAMGVKSSADLQRVSGAKQYAEALQRTAAEVEKYERDVARFDQLIAHANGLMRRLERAEAMAGVDLDEELAGVSEQTMNLDEAFDGTSSTEKLDPIQSADLLDRELQRKPVKRSSTRSGDIGHLLVGKWKTATGKKHGIIEFTKGGAALVCWQDGLRNALGESDRRATLKYVVAGNTLKLEESGDFKYRQMQDMQIEVISDDEIIFVVQKRAMSYDWLEGRVQRVD